MRKTLAALAAAATIAVATLAAPTAAEARWWGGGHVGFRGPGPFFGGLVAGALIAPHFYRPAFYHPAFYYRRPFFAYGYGPGPSCWRTYWNGWRWASYPVC
jgi:hypothetical protein